MRRFLAFTLARLYGAFLSLLGVVGSLVAIWATLNSAPAEFFFENVIQVSLPFDQELIDLGKEALRRYVEGR
tara:strand:- start:886 stop:1101 length:216 start_codon:yes stop_codon:yes gene_type:complete